MANERVLETISTSWKESLAKTFHKTVSTSGTRRDVLRSAGPPSPSSSTSSYHSSQDSPPVSPAGPSYVMYPAPDPSLPAPDVASDIVPPSALTPSHRSLLSLSQPLPDRDLGHGMPASGLLPGSRAHSLVEDGFGRKDSVHSLRNRVPRQSSALGFMAEQPRASGSRGPQILDTPEGSSPYIDITNPTHLTRAGSGSTFSPQPMTIPHTLQQIQTSLAALHERMSTLERTQAVLLRRDERRKGWFWMSSEADDLDDLEEEVDRARCANTATRVKRRRSGLTIPVIWFLFTSIRRAMLDVGMGILVALVGLVVLGGGYRRARVTLSMLIARARKYIKV